MGYILPSKPIANVCFKTYTHISMLQAVSFLQDFKLGHYMKIPPRSMFIVQVCKPHTKLLTISFLLSSLYWINLSEKNKKINNNNYYYYYFLLAKFLRTGDLFSSQLSMFSQKKIGKILEKCVFLV